MKIEQVKVSKLRKHPKNYREHPDDQIKHIMFSIKKYGFYKNIIISKDNYVLAGHGVLKAVINLKKDVIPCCRVDLAHNDPKAIKLLVADNEIARLGYVDKSELDKILNDINSADVDGLLGTGFDEMQLKMLGMIVNEKPSKKDFDEFSEWVGMPTFEEKEKVIQLTVYFRNQAEKMEFAREFKLPIKARTVSSWWPHRENEDISSVKFVTE